MISLGLNRPGPFGAPISSSVVLLALFESECMTDGSCSNRLTPYGSAFPNLRSHQLLPPLSLDLCSHVSFTHCLLSVHTWTLLFSLSSTVFLCFVLNPQCLGLENVNCSPFCCSPAAEHLSFHYVRISSISGCPALVFPVYFLIIASWEDS